MQELFDVTDEKGIPTGKIVSREEAHEKGILHRTAHIWIIRKKETSYEVLLQKRSANKDSFPLMYDTSSAGHIQAGDEPLESALRELFEELGIRAKKEELSFVGIFRKQFEKEFHGKAFRDNEVSFVYVYNKEVDETSFVLQKEEVEGVKWFDIFTVYEGCKHRDGTFCVPTEGIKMIMNYLGLQVH
jgi:isopentenyldiphosphate isomerase